MKKVCDGACLKALLHGLFEDLIVIAGYVAKVG